jgi:hypothetical protein
MKINEKLTSLQQELKAPKNLYNSFGKYKYRNLESILEGVKPLLVTYRLGLTITDEVVAVGSRIYIKAVATLSDLDSDEKITVSAMAREAESKKGMDESQVTGTASSYARKYCMNGLFLIDDTKDADTDEYRMQSERQQETPKPRTRALKKVNESQIQALVGLIARKGKTVEEMLSMVNVGDVRDLTADKYNRIVLHLKDV